MSLRRPTVYFPASPELRILLFVAKAARVSSAGLRPGIRVNSKPQPHGVDILCQAINPLGELLRIGNYVPSRVPFLQRPTVVDINVFVTKVLPAMSPRPHALHVHTSSFNSTSFFAASTKRVPSILQSNAFHEFHPSAGNLPTPPLPTAANAPGSQKRDTARENISSL